MVQISGDHQLMMLESAIIYRVLCISGGDCWISSINSSSTTYPTARSCPHGSLIRQ